MLIEKEFKIYCENIEEGWKYFSTWFYAYNKCAKNPIVYKPRNRKRLLQSEIKEQINSASLYGEFRLISLSALQKSRVMVVARLFDRAYFDKEKLKPQLGLLYLKEKIINPTIQNKIQSILDKNLEFKKSIQTYRNKKLSHNTLDDISKTIKKGVELFFEDMVSLLQDIKKVYGLENSVPYLNTIDGIAQAGIDELFKRIV